mgnify:CR=1 FL=1
MTDQDEIGIVAQGLLDQRRKRHRPELGVDQSHLMAGIEQRTADRQQAEWRQMIVRDAAADGRMRRIDQDDIHGGPPTMMVRSS